MKYIKSNKWKTSIRESRLIEFDERVEPIVFVLYRLYFKEIIDFIAIAEGRMFQTQLRDYLMTTQDLTTRQAETIINQLIYYKLVRTKKAGTNNANLIELTERISILFFPKLYQANISRLRKNTLKAEYLIKKGDLEFIEIFKEKIDEDFINFLNEHSMFFFFADRKDSGILHFYFDLLSCQPMKGEALNEIIAMLKIQMRKLNVPFQLELRLLFQNVEHLIETERNYKRMMFKEIKDVQFENIESERFFTYGKYGNKPKNYKVIKSFDSPEREEEADE